MITYDVKTNTISEKDEYLGGVHGFMSFTRLIELLKSSGEVRKDERVTHIRVDKQGLDYRVEYE